MSLHPFLALRYAALNLHLVQPTNPTSARGYTFFISMTNLSWVLDWCFINYPTLLQIKVDSKQRLRKMKMSTFLCYKICIFLVSLKNSLSLTYKAFLLWNRFFCNLYLLLWFHLTSMNYQVYTFSKPDLRACSSLLLHALFYIFTVMKIPICQNEKCDWQYEFDSIKYILN